MEVQEIIKRRRNELGLTVRDVAAAVDVSIGTISRWESGNIQNMKRDKIYKLAKILNLSPLVLMGYEEESKKEPPSEKEVLIAQLMEHFKDLSPEQLKQVIQYARFLAQTQEGNATDRK